MGLIFRRMLLLSTVAFVYGDKPNKDVVQEATVNLVAVDGSGGELGPLKILSFISESSGHDFRDRFQSKTATNIPYGTYRVKVGHVAHWTTEKTVFAFKPNVSVVVGLPLSELGDTATPSPQWVVSGRIENINPAEQPVYVKLVGLYLDYTIEDKVDLSEDVGRFVLAGRNPQGRYLLMTLGRHHLLDVREIKIPTNAPLEINLHSAQ
jgi:hypothetical protein